MGDNVNIRVDLKFLLIVLGGLLLFAWAALS